jgi:predicted ATPase
LDLLKALPDTLERAQQELALHISLGTPLIAIKGWAAPEVENAYTRARALCHQVGETAQLFPVLLGLGNFYLGRGEYKTARELAEQLLALARSTQDCVFLPEVHYVLGLALYILGEFVPAREHLEQGIALYDPQQHRFHTFLYGVDSKMGCLSYTAQTLRELGYSDQALKRSQETLTFAHELSHPFSLAWAFVSAARFHQFRQEVQLAQEQAEAAIALSTEQGFPSWLAWGTILRGWALAEQGWGEEGIAQIQQGLAAFRASEIKFFRSYSLALLAEAYGKGGQPQHGLPLLSEALDVVGKTGECFYEAELYRLKGELTLQRQFKVPSSEFEVPNTQHLTPRTQAEAEACFLKAIDIARQQQAKSLELRATVSLARLWQQQGKTVEARQTLAEIYGWFTEGFDTADLKDAKALLDEFQSKTH